MDILDPAYHTDHFSFIIKDTLIVCPMPPVSASGYGRKIFQVFIYFPFACFLKRLAEHFLVAAVHKR